jgi:hypothetical protein
MMRSRFAMILITLLTSGATAQDATKTPAGPPPTMIVVSSIDPSGALLSKQLTTRAIPVAEDRVVIEAGIMKKVTVTTYKYVPEERHNKYVLKDLEIYDVKGEKVKQEAALKRLTPGTVVLLSTNGQKVDPAYLRIVKEDTLILVQPAPK